MFCSHCGNPNEDTAKFCSGCGSALTQAAPAAEAPARESAPESDDKLYEAIIGDNNKHYYLRHFKRFDAEGGAGISWHWPALFLTFFWLLYRKMWLNALIYLILPYVIMVPIGISSGLAGDSSGAVLSVAYLLYFFAILLLPPMYANAVYYRHCRKKIDEVASSEKDLSSQLGKLYAKGGTSYAGLVAAVLLLLVPVVGILAAIALPAYQDYTTRARLSEAVDVGNAAARSVADFYNRYQQVPTNLASAGFTAPLPPSVRGLHLDRGNGDLTITLATAPVEGKTVLLSPSVGADKQISWSCSSPDIPTKYLPYRCR